MSDAPEVPAVDAAVDAAVEPAATVEVAADAPAAAANDNSFAQFAVGQSYTGNVVGAKAFGVFVDFKKGTNVLLPRSQLSRGSFERLKRMAETKSKVPT